MPTRPILAVKVNRFTDTHVTKLDANNNVREERPAHWPYLCTPKIDGIRLWYNYNGYCTRTGKLLPNEHVHTVIADTIPAGFDGELLTFTNGEPDPFHTVQSKLMSEDGEPEFKFCIFDYCPPGWDVVGYHIRVQHRDSLLGTLTQLSFLDTVPVRAIHSPFQLEQYEEECLAAGFEGVCGRDPHSLYKSGRSTLTEQCLWKLKRFEDREALIIGVEELQHNTNPATESELGLLKRSKHLAGLTPGGKLGALICKTLDTGIEFRIGTGFTATQRAELWEQRESLPSKLVTYKYQPHGTQSAPRIPIFRGIRYDLA